MNYTANYHLPQWVETDRILMEDFNDMASTLDAALKTNADGLAAEEAAREAAVAAKGNCQLYTATYTGTGNYGSSKKCTLTFPGEPWAVFIGDCGNDGVFLLALRGMRSTHAQAGGTSENHLTWSGSNLQWYSSDDALSQMNRSGNTYRVVALLTA